MSDWPLRTAPFGRPGAGWLLAVLAPIGLGALLRASRRGLVRAPKPERSHPGVGALDQMIVALVPEDERGRAEGIVHGFRQAGVDRGTARELAGLKAQVDEARFGLEGQSHPSSLGSRAEQLLRKLPRPVRQTLGLLALVGAILVARPAGAQEGSALDLYRDGHASLAASKFREQAEAAPEQWQLWYRLAAAEFVSGSDARAAAALERALGLAPRATLARGLWTTLEREHEPLHGAVSSSRLSVPERRALVVLLALTSGVLLGFGLGPRWVGTSTAVVAIVASLVGYSRERFAERPAGYTQSPVVLRFSPHGLAPEAGNLGALTRVVIESQVGKWVLIRDSRDIRGWVSLGAIALVRPLD